MVKRAYLLAHVSAAPVRLGAAASLMAQTGHSDESHSPDEWVSVVVRRMATDNDTVI